MGFKLPQWVYCTMCPPREVIAATVRGPDITQWTCALRHRLLLLCLEVATCDIVAAGKARAGLLSISWSGSIHLRSHIPDLNVSYHKSLNGHSCFQSTACEDSLWHRREKSTSGEQSSEKRLLIPPVLLPTPSVVWKTDLGIRTWTKIADQLRKAVTGEGWPRW